MPPTKLWHYTTAEHMKGILRDRQIRPTALYVELGERPTVWFSANPVWEPTAMKMVKDTRTGVVTRLPPAIAILAKYTTLFRIEVETGAAPIDWPTFKRVSGIKPKIARALEQAARKDGARPLDWYASFEPVGLAHWLEIEFWNKGTWHPFLPDDTSPHA